MKFEGSVNEIARFFFSYPLGEIKMKLVIDTREQRPFTFEAYECWTVRGTLNVGDYSVQGFEEAISVERKSLDDLVGCLMGDSRDRFEKELARSRGLERFVVCIESAYEDVAKHRYKSRMNPVAVIQSLLAFWIRYDTAFYFAGSRAAAEYFTFGYLRKFVEEQGKRWKVCQEGKAA